MPALCGPAQWDVKADKKESSGNPHAPTTCLIQLFQTRNSAEPRFARRPIDLPGFAPQKLLSNSKSYVRCRRPLLRREFNFFLVRHRARCNLVSSDFVQEHVWPCRGSAYSDPSGWRWMTLLYSVSCLWISRGHERERKLHVSKQSSANYRLSSWNDGWTLISLHVAARGLVPFLDCLSVV